MQELEGHFELLQAVNQNIREGRKEMRETEIATSGDKEGKNVLTLKKKKKITNNPPPL